MFLAFLLVSIWLSGYLDLALEDTKEFGTFKMCREEAASYFILEITLDTQKAVYYLVLHNLKLKALIASFILLWL